MVVDALIVTLVSAVDSGIVEWGLLSVSFIVPHRVFPGTTVGLALRRRHNSLCQRRMGFRGPGNSLLVHFIVRGPVFGRNGGSLPCRFLTSATRGERCSQS